MAFGGYANTGRQSLSVFARDWQTRLPFAEPSHLGPRHSPRALAITLPHRFARKGWVTPSQCRAARGLLDWTRQELADTARVGVATIRLFEGDAAESRHATLALLRRTFELAGIEFIDETGGGPGVRLSKRQRGEETFLIRRAHFFQNEPKFL